MFTLLYHVKNIYQALLQNFMYKFYNEIYANKKQKKNGFCISGRATQWAGMSKKKPPR